MTDETPPPAAEHDALSAFLAAASGTPPPEADRALRDALAALRAAPSAGDLAGRDEALAAFAAFRDRRDRGPAVPLLPVVPVGGDATTTSRRLHSVRRWAAGPTAVVVAAGAVLTSGGLTAAAYTGGLPEPVQGYAHRLVGAPAPSPHPTAPRPPALAGPRPVAPVAPTDPPAPAPPADVTAPPTPAPDPDVAGAVPTVGRHPGGRRAGRGHPAPHLGDPGPGRRPVRKRVRPTAGAGAHPPAGPRPPRALVRAPRGSPRPAVGWAARARAPARCRTTGGDLRTVSGAAPRPLVTLPTGSRARRGDGASGLAPPDPHPAPPLTRRATPATGLSG